MRLIYIIFILLILGCTPSRHITIEEAGNKRMIQVALTDFIKEKKLFKNGSVFKISFHSVENNDSLIVLSISQHQWEYLYNDSLLAVKPAYLPSRYLEYNGKLFYWWDKTVPVNGTIISKLEQFSVIRKVGNADPLLYPLPVNERLKAAHYFFCRRDSGVFEKKITNRGLGSYEVPVLNCKGNQKL